MPQQDYAFLQINDLIDSGQLAMVRWIALWQLLTVLIAYLALDFAIPIYYADYSDFCCHWYMATLVWPCAHPHQ